MIYSPAVDNNEERVRDSFAQQAVMKLFGADLARVTPGEVQIRFPYRADLTQQHGYLHAGVVAAVCDSACGYAAFSLMPADAAVLTVEYKVNLLAPAEGTDFLAIGKVTKRGGTLSVCHGEIVADPASRGRAVASMQATVMTVVGRGIFE
jgi:uncharacterized protein (TIGR00369 family)